MDNSRQARCPYTNHIKHFLKGLRESIAYHFLYARHSVKMAMDGTVWGMEVINNIFKPYQGLEIITK